MNHRIYRARPAEEVEQIIAEYKGSGLTQQEFANRQGLKVTALRRWLYRKPKPGPSSPALVEVEVGPPSPSGASTHYRLELPGGKVLSFSGPLRVEELKQLCHLLSE
jgi:hypothetical protein